MEQLAFEGMERVARRAEELRPGWESDALVRLREWLTWHAEPFIFEEFRIWAERRGMDKPHDDRAWGQVAHRAGHMGLMRKLKSARKATLAPHYMPEWRSNIYKGP